VALRTPLALKVLVPRLAPWLLLLIGAVALYVGNQRLAQVRATEQWPTTDGKVISTSVESRGTGNQVTYHALILYEFRLHGAVFHGTRLGIGDQDFRSRAEAQQVTDRYPPGRDVLVHYNPNVPGESILQPGSTTWFWVVVGLGGVFVLLGLVLAVTLPRAILRVGTRLTVL
jgi:hypothetical protein